jgi:hypothetical protein
VLYLFGKFIVVADQGVNVLPEKLKALGFIDPARSFILYATIVVDISVV